MRTIVLLSALSLAVGAGVVVGVHPGWAGEGDALEALGKAYHAAFDGADADALAACFAPDAGYRTAGGDLYEGRDAIRELAAGFFAANPGAKISGERRGIRKIGERTMVTEGIVTIRDADGRILSRTDYVAVLQMADVAWVISSLTENDHGLTPREHLESLAWLVGDWHDETDAAMVRSSCKWSEDGPFLIQKFTIREADGRTRTATQRIGWDAAHRKIRSWIWNSNGAYGGAVWTSVKDGWILQARGVSEEGVVGTMTHRIRKESEDVVRWETTNRILGDEMLPDETHVIVRCPPEPE